VNLDSVGWFTDTRTVSAGVGIEAAKHRRNHVIRGDFTTLLFQFPDFSLRDVSAKEMYV